MQREAIVVAVMMTLAMPGTAPAAEAAPVQDLYRLSYATEARGDPAGALHFMDEAARQGETGYVLHLRRGWLLHLARRHADSAVAYSRAIELEPRALEPRLGGMLPLMAQRRWKEAERLGQDALSIAPGDFTAQSRLAFIQYSQGNFAQAEAWYRGALAAYPGSVEMRVGLAWSLLKQRHLTDARAEFEKALRFAPDNPSANEGLGQF
jgi:tetratricopeptide (TPR) repeat protein